MNSYFLKEKIIYEPRSPLLANLVFLDEPPYKSSCDRVHFIPILKSPLLRKLQDVLDDKIKKKCIPADLSVWNVSFFHEIKTPISEFYDLHCILNRNINIFLFHK